MELPPFSASPIGSTQMRQNIKSFATAGQAYPVTHCSHPAGVYVGQKVLFAMINYTGEADSLTACTRRLAACFPQVEIVSIAQSNFSGVSPKEDDGSTIFLCFQQERHAVLVLGAYFPERSWQKVREAFSA